MRIIHNINSEVSVIRPLDLSLILNIPEFSPIVAGLEYATHCSSFAVLNCPAFLPTRAEISQVARIESTTYCSILGTPNCNHWATILF
jgi:hypothetical protein